MNAAVRSDTLAPYYAAFETVRAKVADTAAARAAAFDHFASVGFPEARDEAWKYTSLRRLEARRFASEPASSGAVDEAIFPAIAAHRVDVVNGHVVVDARSGLPDGVTVRNLARALADGEPQSTLLRVAMGGGTERFVALNAALCPDALIVDIAEGARSEGSLHIVLAASGSATMSHPRLLLRAGRASSSRIVIYHQGSDGTERLVNSFVDVEAAPDSTLRLYRLQAQGSKSFLIERIEATIGQRATLQVHDAQLGASLARLDLHARLAAPGATAELTGLFLADGSRHLDAHVRADHIAPDTRSLVDYRGIAAGRGRAVFNGKAVVHAGAQKSQARQVSRNLLLTPGAEIDTKPELEIYADDVQCSHGATTGQLDAEALFYLRSRGLGEVEARGALTRAFARAVLSRMDHQGFADTVHSMLDDRLVRLLEVPA